MGELGAYSHLPDEATALAAAERDFINADSNHDGVRGPRRAVPGARRCAGWQLPARSQTPPAAECNRTRGVIAALPGLRADASERRRAQLLDIYDFLRFYGALEVHMQHQAERRARSQAAFAKFDTNSDGALDAFEFRAACIALGLCHSLDAAAEGQRLAAEFARLDVDRCARALRTPHAAPRCC